MFIVPSLSSPHFVLFSFHFSAQWPAAWVNKRPFLCVAEIMTLGPSQISTVAKNRVKWELVFLVTVTTTSRILVLRMTQPFVNYLLSIVIAKYPNTTNYVVTLVLKFWKTLYERNHYILCKHFIEILVVYIFLLLLCICFENGYWI